MLFRSEKYIILTTGPPPQAVVCYFPPESYTIFTLTLLDRNQLEDEYRNKEFDIEWKYKSKIKSLEKENNHLHKIIDKFYETIDKFIHWICKKFDMGAEDNLIRDFQKETNTFLDAEKQLKHEEREKEWDLER